MFDQLFVLECFILFSSVSLYIIALAWTRNMANLVTEYEMYLKVIHHFGSLDSYGIVHVLYEQMVAAPEQVNLLYY